MDFVSATDKSGNSVDFSQLTVSGTVDTTTPGTYEVTYSYDGVESKAKITVSEVKGKTPEVDPTLPTTLGTNIPELDQITESSGSTDEGSKLKDPSNPADNRNEKGKHTNPKVKFLPALNAKQSVLLSVIGFVILFIGTLMAFGVKALFRKKH